MEDRGTLRGCAISQSGVNDSRYIGIADDSLHQSSSQWACDATSCYTRTDFDFHPLTPQNAMSINEI